jgi:hypothetical protein
MFMTPRALIEIRSNVGFMDGDYAIAVVNAATRQSTVPPLAFPTREAAESVVAAIVNANPDLYVDRLTYEDE